MKYERLTERDKKGVAVYKQKCYADTFEENIYIYVQREEAVVNRLAELEDKIENGTLIELPCKVGDMAYYVTKHENDYVIEFGYVKSISIERGGIWFACHYNSGLSYWHNYKDNYGSLFFNFAEAEAKLKELKGEV